MIFRILFFAFLSCLSASCGQDLCAQETATGTQVFRGIPYAKIDQRELKLDLFVPEKLTSKVLLINVHGGAWRAGSRASVPIKGLIERGFALASVDYRLSPEAKFPANVHDIKAAIRFLRSSNATYGISTEKIVIVGASAGGHLAALVGVTNEHEELEGDIGLHTHQSSSVNGIVSFYGASNLETILSQSTPHGLSVRVGALELLLGGKPDDSPDLLNLARLASPVSHVDATDPPLLLIHGDQDQQMPINQSLELQSVYETANLSVEFINVHGGGHGGTGFFDSVQLDRVETFLRPLGQ